MKKSLLLISVSMALFAASCSNEDLEQMTKADVPALPQQEIAKGIAPEITNLKSSDAEIVANRFVSFFNSRSEDRSIKNVVTIPNSEGEPALYAVNFDNGYVIVSASKNLPPIVADVDNGNFSLEDQPSGRDIIIQQLISESDYWRKTAAMMSMGKNGGTSSNILLKHRTILAVLKFSQTLGLPCMLN